MVAWIQSHKGIMTMPEFRALTGLSPLEAEERITVYLKDYLGEPTVSDNGSILFSFPDLLLRADRSDRTMGGTVPMQRLSPFSGNKGNANFWFAGINLVNLLFGGYFIANSMVSHTVHTVMVRGREVIQAGWDFLYIITYQLAGMLGLAHPALALGIGLGAVPTAFALFFYGIPAVRYGLWKSKNERVKEGNLRRAVYRAVLDKPRAFDPRFVDPAVAEATPADPKAKDRIVVELAAAEGGEPGADGSYTWEGIERAQRDAVVARAAVREESSELGKAVFDSHDREPGL